MCTCRWKIVFLQSNLTRNKPLLSISPVPSESQHKIYSMASLVVPYNAKSGTVVVCFDLIQFVCFVWSILTGLLHIYYVFRFGVSMGFLSVQTCMSLHLYTFLVLFLVWLLVMFFLLAFIHFIVLWFIIFPWMPVCFLRRDKMCVDWDRKDDGKNWEDRRRETISRLYIWKETSNKRENHIYNIYVYSVIKWEEIS